MCIVFSMRKDSDSIFLEFEEFINISGGAAGPDLYSID